MYIIELEINNVLYAVAEMPDRVAAVAGVPSEIIIEAAAVPTMHFIFHSPQSAPTPKRATAQRSPRMLPIRVRFIAVP